jgi:hypothetical protein
MMVVLNQFLTKIEGKLEMHARTTKKERIGVICSYKAKVQYNSKTLIKYFRNFFFGEYL